ncbi:uncharacterized protein LOC129738388 [Uranotaenia lowii]|uniref:uncharacterized protein LOC129738388 n=1 Tax=Uranotaenia lowii TaxID=190385 RepID=UPI002479FCA4|nr:uncharacterized protein LOC129738388 [Uranotaenia lowii]
MKRTYAKLLHREKIMQGCGDSPCDLTAIPREKVTRDTHKLNHSYYNNGDGQSQQPIAQQSRHALSRPKQSSSALPVSAAPQSPPQIVKLPTLPLPPSRASSTSTDGDYTENAQFAQTGMYPPNYDLVHNCIRGLPSEKVNCDPPK